jgi:tRNA 2-thiouridine synthesizing protein A
LNNQISSQLKFLDNPIKADSTTDIIYMMCPMHLLTIKHKIKEIDLDQVLAVLTDYEGALEDIPAWCEISGNEFLGVMEEEDHYTFYLRKLKE